MKIFMIFLVTFAFAAFAFAYVDMSASRVTLKTTLAQQPSNFSVNLTQIKLR